VGCLVPGAEALAVMEDPAVGAEVASCRGRREAHRHRRLPFGRRSILRKMAAFRPLYHNYGNQR
jgi:hypothetical protein